MNAKAICMQIILTKSHNSKYLSESKPFVWFYVLAFRYFFWFTIQINSESIYWGLNRNRKACVWYSRYLIKTSASEEVMVNGRRLKGRKSKEEFAHNVPVCYTLLQISGISTLSKCKNSHGRTSLKFHLQKKCCYCETKTIVKKYILARVQYKVLLKYPSIHSLMDGP